MEEIEDQDQMYRSVMRFENYLITNPGIDIAYICIMKSIMGKVLLTRESSIHMEHFKLIKQSYGYTKDD